VPVRVSLRETFAGTAKGHGRHVKQSGGHGQYAVCDIEVEPLPSGSGFEFVDKVVGGAVPRQFIPSVEKGVRAQMDRGVAAGYPVIDVRVTLFDGKAHSVDSSDMAFQTAGALALKEAAKGTQMHMLEPIDEVSCPRLRRVRRRGHERPVGAPRPRSGHRARRHRTHLGPGRVPQTEITRYAIDLRSISHGTGTFTRRYVGHEPMPSHLAAKVVAEASDN
jgi:elongation factor G